MRNVQPSSSVTNDSTQGSTVTTEPPYVNTVQAQDNVLIQVETMQTQANVPTEVTRKATGRITRPCTTSVTLNKPFKAPATKGKAPPTQGKEKVHATQAKGKAPTTQAKEKAPTIQTKEKAPTIQTKEKAPTTSTAKTHSQAITSKPPFPVQAPATRSPMTRSKAFLTRPPAEGTKSQIKRKQPPKGVGVYTCPESGSLYHKPIGAKRGRWLTNFGPRNHANIPHQITTPALSTQGSSNKVRRTLNLGGLNLG
ncbi:hypothetical protein ACHQM5_024654 [Ranunculus cassubicifolius]